MPEPAFHARRIPFLHSPPDFSPTTRTERSLGRKNPELGRDFPVPHSAMYREQDCVLPIGHPGYRPVAARAGKARKATGKPPSKQPLSRYSPGFSVAKQRVSSLAVHKVQPWGLVGQRNCVHPFPVALASSAIRPPLPAFPIGFEQKTRISSCQVSPANSPYRGNRHRAKVPLAALLPARPRLAAKP